MKWPFSRLVERWNQFFFARTHERSLVFMGYLRIFYGVLLLYDRLILGLDFHLFFISSMIPCQQYFHPMSNVATTKESNQHIHPGYPSSPLCTMASFLPASFYPTLAWSFFYLGLIHILLLIVGVAPKLQLLAIQFNLLSFYFYTPLLWDGEDTMIPIWNFLFLFLPLHHVTVYDLFRKTRLNSKATDPTKTSWPMWPFRLFQFEVCFIYLGAGFGKFAQTSWRSGNAMYHVIHQKDFFGGPWVPEFIFRRYGPLKIMTWASLFLECSSILLVWLPFRRMRYSVVAAMILLHVGIDLAMNMHIFEWLSIIGWCMFLFEPSAEPHASFSVPRAAASTVKMAVWHRRWVINGFLIFVLLIFFIDTFPLLNLYSSTVIVLYPALKSFVSSATWKRVSDGVTQLELYRTKRFTNPFVRPYLDPLGLRQGEWNMYADPSDEFCRIETIISLYRNPPSSSESITSDIEALEDISILSPDWDTLTWYEKKRWQRPMTMYANLPEFMCLDCFANYQARQYMEQQSSQSKDVVTSDVSIASIALNKRCASPPPPPTFDDWWNWTGWFYADAKQTIFESKETESLIVLNLCNDLSDQCDSWKLAGFCDVVSDHHSKRYTLSHEISDHFRFTMTQLCRRSCRWCAEDGYDADVFLNGTRVSVVWPVPLKIMYDGAPEDEASSTMYYDATIIQVKDHPMKRYLLQYDISGYDHEWFDPIILRERGYRLISNPETSMGDDRDSFVNEHTPKQLDTKLLDEL